jgi:hypothetical protein
MLAKEILTGILGKITKHVRNTYMKSMQAPANVKPALKGWMELS